MSYKGRLCVNSCKVFSCLSCQRLFSFCTRCSGEATSLWHFFPSLCTRCRVVCACTPGSAQGNSVITFCGFCLLGLVGEPGCLGNPCRLLFQCCVSQGVPGLEVGGFGSRACLSAALWQLVCLEGGAACVLWRSSALIGWNGTTCCLFARHRLQEQCPPPLFFVVLSQANVCLCLLVDCLVYIVPDIYVCVCQHGLHLFSRGMIYIHIYLKSTA